MCIGIIKLYMNYELKTSVEDNRNLRVEPNFWVIELLIEYLIYLFSDYYYYKL